MYIFEHYTRKHKKRHNAKIIYNTSLPVLFGVKYYADALWEVCNKRKIEVNTRTNLVEIYPEKRQALFQNLDEPEKKTVLEVSVYFLLVPSHSTSNDRFRA